MPHFPTVPLRVWIAVLLCCAGCGEASASAALTVSIDARAPSRRISPYIYGVNDVGRAVDAEGVYTLLRFGGTRTSAYNWENNASNAGHDWPANQNDGYLSESTAPGAAVLEVLDEARRTGAAALITVPMIGRVAADRDADGDVNRSRDFLRTRFDPSRARGGADTPDPSDGAVHQDAFVRFVRDEARRRGVRVFFALDNEPGAWPAHHPRLREGQPLTYAEIARRSVEYASMIRENAERAPIFGPVSLGWPEMQDLMDAPDAERRFFLAFYLDTMRSEQQRRGTRPLDVLDVHWYPDARVADDLVTSDLDHPEIANLRMQVPRSLYDRSYIERTWIADDVLGPVELIPRLGRIVRANYPGTRIAITEYAYGGGSHPSGAVAQADALGAFGRYGLFAAAWWPLSNQEHTYTLAAFRMYRRIDGEISFGDRSIPAVSNDLSRLSAWASLDSRHRGRIVIVLVARSDRRESATVTLQNVASPGPLRRFVLDRGGPAPRELEAIEPRDGARYIVPMAPRSVTTLILDP